MGELEGGFELKFSEYTFWEGIKGGGVGVGVEWD